MCCPTLFLSSLSCSSFWKCFSLSTRCFSASSRALASASSFWNTHGEESNHNFNAGRGRRKKNFSQNDMPLRNKGVVALSNYCLQPQKRYFPIPFSQKDLFSSFTALWEPFKNTLHNYIGSCLTINATSVKDHKVVAKHRCNITDHLEKQGKCQSWFCLFCCGQLFDKQII